MIPLKKASFPLIAALLLSFGSISISSAQSAGAYPEQYGKPYKDVPDRRDVMMYQVNTRSFSNTGDFKGVTARLDSIKALGINVIYLMPIYQVGVLKGSNSPYAT